MNHLIITNIVRWTDELSRLRDFELGRLAPARCLDLSQAQ